MCVCPNDRNVRNQKSVVMCNDKEEAALGKSYLRSSGLHFPPCMHLDSHLPWLRYEPWCRRHL